MARIKGLRDELLDLSLRELIELGKSIEEEIGINFIPMVDVRILPSPKRGCIKEEIKGKDVILLKIGEMKGAVRKILELVARLSKKEIEQIFANGYGLVANNIEKVRADYLKTTLEAVGSEIELK